MEFCQINYSMQKREICKENEWEIRLWHCVMDIYIYLKGAEVVISLKVQRYIKSKKGKTILVLLGNRTSMKKVFPKFLNEYICYCPHITESVNCKCEHFENSLQQTPRHPNKSLMYINLQKKQPNYRGKIIKMPLSPIKLKNIYFK